MNQRVYLFGCLRYLLDLFLHGSSLPPSSPPPWASSLGLTLCFDVVSLNHLLVFIKYHAKYNYSLNYTASYCLSLNSEDYQCWFSSFVSVIGVGEVFRLFSLTWKYFFLHLLCHVDLCAKGDGFIFCQLEAMPPKALIAIFCQKMQFWGENAYLESFLFESHVF